MVANRKTKDVVVQRDILGLLAGKSCKEKMPINMNEALKYPLAPVPLSLATADGSRRSTPKSKIMEVILPAMEISDTTDEVPNGAVYIIDLIAYLCSLVNVPDTFRLLVQRIVADIPARYKVIYFACDTYNKIWIKSDEQAKRGESDEYIIRTPDIRIPSNFSQFMQNGKNKERMLELIETVLAGDRNRVRERVIYFARGDLCTRITSNSSEDVPSLASDHVEADSKIVYLAYHALAENSGRPTVCVVRSCSGDTDIPIIILGNECENLTLLTNSGGGKSRQVINLSECTLTRLQKDALLGLHAFTGNDYISSFFHKGKKTWWRLIKDKDNFLKIFAGLGSQQNLSSELFEGLQKVVCEGAKQ